MRNISHITLKRRLFAAALLIAFLFCILIARLFYIQVVDGSALSGKAYGQWTRDLPMKANRGDITDRNGVVLASSYTTYTVYVRPNEMEDVAAVSSAISQVSGEEYARVYARVSKKGVSEVRVVTGLSEAQSFALRGYGYPGLYVVADSARYYEYGNFATQLLGFVNADGDGQSGIEMYYDSLLKGVDGAAYTETDLVGNKLDGTNTTYRAVYRKSRGRRSDRDSYDRLHVAEPCGKGC